MAAQKRPSAGSYSARGSLRKGWFPLPGSQLPGSLGAPKKFCALTGPETTLPDVSRTSHEVLTPWSTKLGAAASAMPGGLQPWAKYEQVVAEPCCPMKLEDVPGVD